MMNFEVKKRLRDAAGHAYGLLNVLKCDIDILRKDTAECNRDKIRESIREADKTLQDLLLTIGQIEHILNLDKNEGP